MSGLIINPYRFGSPRPLDLVPGAAAAYGTRKLRTAYSGFALRLENAFSATLDVGFDSAGELDWAAITAFFGGSGDGYIIKWYDQSGNANDATESIFNAPRVYSGGALYTANGRNTLYWDATKKLQLTSSITGGAFSAAVVVQVSSSATSRTIIGGSVNSAWTLRLETDHRVLMFLANVAVVKYSGAAVSPTSAYHQIYASGGASGSQTVGVDGSYSTASSSQAYQPITRLGADDASGVARYSDYMNEIIIYASVLSDPDRDILAANQKAYYGTP